MSSSADLSEEEQANRTFERWVESCSVAREKMMMTISQQRAVMV